jgi:hypothetical protein
MTVTFANLFETKLTLLHAYNVAVFNFKVNKY